MEKIEEMETFLNATPQTEQLKPAMGPRISAVIDLAQRLFSVASEVGEPPVPDFKDGINLSQELRRYEIELIQKALELTGNHQVRAARLLNLKPTTLNAKIKRHNIHL